jgi:hypothetical protein
MIVSLVVQDHGGGHLDVIASSSSDNDEESLKINTLKLFIYITQLPMLNLIDKTKHKNK